MTHLTVHSYHAELVIELAMPGSFQLLNENSHFAGQSSCV
jgi:hypothetical protein